jgi:uncharacterized protein YjdB
MSVRRLLTAATILISLSGCATKVAKPVVTVPLSSLVVLPATDTLQVGEIVQFTVAAVDTNGAPLLDPILSWRSGNTVVFSVDGAGKVRALSEGTGTLYVSSGGKTATAALMVLPATRGWFQQTSNTSNDLRGVSFLSDGNTGWAVGTLGKIIHTGNAGATWITQFSNLTTSLNSVWFTSPAEGWAVGDGGRIVHTSRGGNL